MVRPAGFDEFAHIAGDRRHDRRYELDLPTRWKLIRRRRVLETGVGRTLDLSSGGILFDAGRPLLTGYNVELSIAWPVLLQGTASLQLVVSGRIVRVDGTRIAIRTAQHEFRTTGVHADHRKAPGTAQTTPFLHTSGFTVFGKIQ
jgi:hypothetical protein